MPITREDLEEKFRAFYTASNNLVDLFHSVDLPVPPMQAENRQEAMDARSNFFSLRQEFTTFAGEAQTAARGAVEKAGPYLP